MQRQENNCKFEASLIYTESSWLAGTTQWDPVSKLNQQKAKGYSGAVLDPQSDSNFTLYFSLYLLSLFSLTAWHAFKKEKIL